MTPKEYFDAGQLTEAISAGTDEVRGHPTDVTRRLFFSELLAFTGDLDRADLQLEAILRQEPDAVKVLQFRQLLRAEKSRHEFYSEGRLPEYLHEPPPHLRLHLEASVRIREGKLGEAADLLGQAEEQRPAVGGVCDGEPFDFLRDLDDLTASFFEILTTNGKYYWVPFEVVESIEFRAPQRPRELLWRSIHLSVRGGPDGEVFVPALYWGSHQADDENVRLGRVTDWQGEDGVLIRGIGQRTLLFGETDRTILELKNLTINAPNS